MSYDYKSCFWDPHDDGVNVLLSHIASGIRSCHTMEQFFKQRSELEKDYARRLGAIREKLNKDCEKQAEYGKLGAAYGSLLGIEKARAQAYSKKAELLYRKLFSDVKLVSAELQARYTTLSGKVEKLRMDKYNKRKGCDELQKRLEEAEVRARALKLNQNNTIGARRTEQNTRELAKWEANVKEISTQLSVLKKEYKASQKFWLHEWADVTAQIQDMENARISFLQRKLQDYADVTIEASVLEQSKMDLLISELSSFTPMDDISKFSSDFGTGRLKDKHQRNLTSEPPVAQQSQRAGSNPYSSSKRYSYMDNIRKLSTQLQQSVQRQSSPSQYERQPSLVKSQTGGNLMNQRPNDQLRHVSNSSSLSTNRYSLHESNLPSYGTRDYPVGNTEYRNIDHELSRSDQDTTDRDVERSNPEIQKMKTIDSRTPLTSNHAINDKELQTYNGRHLEATQNDARSTHTKTESTTDSSSSNPTDFTANARRRPSMESMSTSVSSMASSIDDKQRFAKSWNSANRKRKSMSHIGYTDQHALSVPLDQKPNDMRQESSNTILIKSVGSHQFNERSPQVQRPSNITASNHTRRKSMVSNNSLNPIGDALYEMEKLQGGVSNDSTLGRVKDNGIVVTLPIVTKTGKDVIKYAKATYPLLDNSAAEVAHFDKGDYLLITEVVSEDWYLGEVYDDDKIEPDHKFGLIPFNFIQILT
ncbi:formin-binding protein HOF1 KNAG_0M02270 [Huiozyma naganishii CBS 8797]|uniref:SH3 domain-containing protein n=1 Tax=Huiozyma naganishii (strain ATCC MYA-139 / BCRC 22969 / CBS 8797 / KCTC 17520 / NBRC 10181 / NCYC 3082 / Yp74L-3) TaxID=1071383 RepID=J7RE13_HUIN7|nr:hypothetical protein KNAG_0M02270 [Kazachstania naganishii CBS 8797]CCK73080.1 hypothetical protein KNAG_0M02270 [Kazachstania naganishii CBS 8797]